MMAISNTRSGPRFHCPNCNALRKAAFADCDECRYPHHERLPDVIYRKVSSEPFFQFDIWTLFVWMTFAAVLAALLNRFTVLGLFSLLPLCNVLIPTLLFFYRLYHNLAEYRRLMAMWKTEKLDDSKDPNDPLR